MIPADHACVDFEGLERIELATELCDRVADNWERPLLSRDTHEAGTSKPMHAADIRKG
jgi:hypothetical protein